MEAKDAWLLLASAVIGVVTSLLATFTAPPVGTAFGKLKSGFIERNKSGALARYVEVRDLRSGKWDKYLYALDSWGFILIWLSAFWAVSIIGNLTNNPIQNRVMMLLAALTLLLACRRVVYYFLTIGRVRNFEDYRAQLLKRWPDLVLPE